MLIPFPTFESNLTAMLDAAEELRIGRLENATASLAAIQRKLGRIHGSARHARLAEHVGDAVGACRRGEAECALYVLVAAFSAFIPRKAA